MLHLTSKHRFSIGSNGVLLFAFAVWTGAVIHMMALPGPGFLILRTLLPTMVVIWIVFLYRSSKPILLVSPLFVLGLFALLAYSLIEFLYAQIPNWLSHGGVDQSIIAYSGSWGEALVLQFVAFCLFATALAVRILPDQTTGFQRTDPGANWRGVAPATTAALVIMLVCEVLVAEVPLVKQFAGVGLGKQLAHAIEPMTALSFAILAYLASMRGRAIPYLYFGLAIAYLGIRSGIGLVQMPILIIGMITAFYLIAGIRQIRTIFVAFLASVVLITGIFFVVAQTRYTWLVEQEVSTLQLLKTAISSKGVIRQGRTAACFNKIVVHHRPAFDQEKPFYFLSAIVPRVFWPEKPIVSRGTEYAVRYCGADKAPNDQHYELISVLGEPVLMGGISGLVVAQSTMGLGLFFVALAMLRGGPITVITVVALLPWLIHFQQSFALYFANSVKMFFYMVPAIAILWWWGNRRRSREPVSTP